MFTGIIETTGSVVKKSTDRLIIRSELSEQLKKGDSIAIDGVCFTAVELSGDTFAVEFMPETAKKTIIGDYNKNVLVNLELPMRTGGRFGGHMVSGHVDTVAKVVGIESERNAKLLALKIPLEWDKYLVPKGSVTINGISLTIVSVDKGRLMVSLIPHTWNATNLKTLKPDDRVNLEVDLLAKYIEKLISDG